MKAISLLQNIVTRAAGALTREERDLAAKFLEGALRDGIPSLRSVWIGANGQLGPSLEGQRAFTEAAIRSLREPALAFREDWRIQQTREA